MANAILITKCYRKYRRTTGVRQNQPVLRGGYNNMGITSITQLCTFMISLYGQNKEVIDNKSEMKLIRSVQYTLTIRIILVKVDVTSAPPWSYQMLHW